MRIRSVPLSIVALVSLVAVTLHSQGPGNAFDPAKVEREILAHFAAFNGRMAGVALWDSYFFKSPGIGNIHDDKLADLGWEQWHKSNVEYFSKPRLETVEITNLRVHPIHRNLAWVAGEYSVTVDGKTRTARFYDAMLRTDGRWSAFMSVVNPKKD